MASRLEVTHGLIAEPDRHAGSGDTLVVTRPDTGSRSRSKGLLAVLAIAPGAGPRGREATRLVAETLRAEYYYDGSAGVAVCLAKAIRSAERRLRAAREGAGLAPGAVGLGVAVVRESELYLATLGDVEAYLVRGARLLMPERGARPGLPTAGAAEVDVWRGELAVGDALLLVARRLTETVGTEELKSAVLTLHPQAAAEHLHHLFTAAGGTGSDAVIALEASERTTPLTSRAPRPRARGGDGYGDLGAGVGRPVAVGVGSLPMSSARNPVGAWMNAAVERAWEAMPRRRLSARGISARISRAETERRAALGVLALVGVIFVLGLVVVLLPSGGDRAPQAQVVAGVDSALSGALDRVQRAENLVAVDPGQALSFFREAWGAIEAARGAELDAAAADLEARVRAGLDTIYGAREPAARTVVAFPLDTDPDQLARGPDGALYFIEQGGAVVTRVDPADSAEAEVVHRGDKSAAGRGRIGSVAQLEGSPREVVLFDDEAQAWRWRPSDDTGRGTLAKLSFLGDTLWTAEHGDIATFSSPFGYRLYVVEPSQRNILRFQPTFDGSAFNVPNAYLVTDSDIVADFRQLHIDADLYALTPEGVQQYKSGRFQGGFSLGEPPDTADLRPGSDYRLIAGTGTDASGGLLYLYDARWDRVVVFDKATGAYVRQWVPGPDGPSMAGTRGLVVVPGAKKRPDTLYWITPEGLFEARLAIAAPAASPAPDGEAKPRKGGRRKPGS